MVRLLEGSAPKTHNVTHTITVAAEIPAEGAEGVLVCLGGEMGGWTLFVDDGRLVYHYNWLDLEHREIVAAGPVPAGPVELRCEFENLTDTVGGPARVRLLVNGEQRGAGRLDNQVRGRFSLESLDVGRVALSAVAPRYAGRLPFAFTGTLHQVRFDFGGGAELTPAERVELGLRLD
jgi:arylsulfatase